MADKDLANMIAALTPVAAMFLATTVPHARARTADRLADEIRKLTSVPVEPATTPDAAVVRALEQSKRAVACGSIYMIGPLRARLIEGGATRILAVFST
jgi:folylpolyglutamate synthase/dihydropteroate synthase